MRHRQRFFRIVFRLQRETQEFAQMRPIVPPLDDLRAHDLDQRPLHEAEPEQQPAQQHGDDKPDHEIEPA